jgi:hypothetical protein
MDQKLMFILPCAAIFYILIGYASLTTISIALSLWVFLWCVL